MSCADVQTIQAGNGSKTQFSFDFPYLFKTEIEVSFWNATTKEWDVKATTDATYPWQVTDANPTIVEFTSTAPPSPATPTDPGEPTVDNVRIRRVTNIDDIRALFNPGSAIRSDDLNKNFEQLRYAIQEANCQSVPTELYDFLRDYYWDKYDSTIYSTDTWVSAENKIASTKAVEEHSELLFDTIVQTTTPVGSDWQVGKTWLQNDDNLTLSIWNGSAWLGIASGGTFTNQPQVVYVDTNSGDDNNDGHRISRPKASIKAAVEQINADATYGDGSVVIVAAGVYQEVAPIQIDKKNVSIIGQALRSCIVHPTSATETNTLFELNSGSYVANLTLTGMKAGTGTGNTVDATLPTDQGWNFAFRSGATITKSPYIQNCTNFSDSEIDNNALNAVTPAGGAAGDTDSAPTGGGLLINGATVDSASPLRSMVCDSYTHVGLNGPGILVTNNGYVQATSSYAFFNKYHIKCLNGGQANLAASTTDFGDQALVADGKSTTAIFTAALSTAAGDGDITFTIDEPTADASWHGTATRPATNMLVELNSIIYPILSATANGAGWDVTISRPNPSNRSENLGLNGAVSTPATASFFLRSMIASSGHTMEYVGSGTDYRALPENGGVPDETKQITESNNGKVWTAITDHNGKFKIGGNQTTDPIFEVDQQLGFVTIPEGSIAFNLLSDLTPQLGGDLDVNGNTITGLPAAPTANDEAVSKQYVDTQSVTEVVDDLTPQLGGDLDANGHDIILDTGAAATPSLTFTGDTNTGIYSPGADQVAISTGGTGKLFVDDQGRVGIGTASPQSELTVRGATPRITIEPTDDATQNCRIEFALADGTVQSRITGGGSLGSVIRFSQGPTERARIDSAGRLGLGTSSPSNTLHVQADVSGGDLVYFNNTNAVTSDVLRLNTLGIGTGTYIIDAQSGGTSRFVVNGAGNVGIGATNPATLLHLASSNPGIRLQDTDGGRAMLLGSGGDITLDADPDNQVANSAIVFRVDDNERLRIEGNGALGLSGANYGTSGQVLTSNGSGSAPTWQNPGLVAVSSEVATTSGSEIEFTGLTGVSHIVINFNRVIGTNFATGADILVNLGTSAGYVTSNYVSTSVNHTGFSDRSSTTGFVIYSPGSGNGFSGQMVISKINSNATFTSTHEGYTSDGNTRSGGGSLDSSTANPVDKVKISVTTGSFDSGSLNIVYW
jgi:hypothetical protein